MKKYACKTDCTVGETNYNVKDEIDQPTWEAMSPEDQANFNAIGGHVTVGEETAVDTNKETAEEKL